ncbi:hypothetical protein AB4343_09590 [Vibrio breoganii]|uniref:DUF3316 domain-containing protein n=1 Tax=Vibrio breoganii TaxID=553239 RepID=A0AAP8SW45_9VIBR|nr:hypothetical protein [Vibrio breoganii]OCH75854.1 hypothetical protein A6D95_10620 [Vibrio breoganii]PMF97999.1 hypothetical protein BCV02_17720 [Vibrio breoganii]PMG34542.1 hypothetical protein BCU93_18365 [Vibrio breoganii]PMG82063.1 hypothetical protein BCU81_16640 [Vibrio breoganii]PMK15887.1 hypothetical protein BCU06_12895 [Vibrio breoganii]
MINRKLALTTLALFSALALSQGALAKDISNDQSFTQLMTQVDQVTQSGDVFVATDSAFSKTETALDIETEFKDIYISQDEAKELGLTQSKTFSVYSVANIQKISDKISDLVRKDEPNYFSVELNSTQMGAESNMVEYVAKVTEYN